MWLFNNRDDAAAALAQQVSELKEPLKDCVVLGIPRGGIPIAYTIAKKIGSKFDALILRKLPVPGNPETGFGAVTLDRAVTLNEPLLSQLYLSKEEIKGIVDKVYKEVLRRNKVYRKDRPFPELKGRDVILTDDGLATGFTMLAAVRFARQKKAAQVLVAVPVAHQEAFRIVGAEADKMITLHISSAPYFAVASFYKEFTDLSDAQVADYLDAGRGQVEGDKIWKSSLS